MTNTILELARGIVRPASLLAIVGAVIGFAAAGNFDAAKFVAAFGGPIMGFWFLERKQRHDDRAP